MSVVEAHLFTGPILEDLIIESGERLKRLQILRKNGQLDLGRTLDQKKADVEFDKVCNMVEKFLNYSSKEECDWEYWDHDGDKNSYERPERKMILARSPEAILLPTIGHEYAHHLQYELCERYPHYKQGIYKEGHARKVERQIAERLAKQRKNDAFLWHITNEDLAEFKSVYLWTCDNQDITPDPRLLKYKSYLDKIETASRESKGRPTTHAIGNALYQVFNIY